MAKAACSMWGSVVNSVSIYFYAGDFVDVLRRYEEGRQQIYQTHNEVARLIHDLRSANYRVKIYSFVTPDRRDEEPIDGVRIVSLGAKDYSTKSVLEPVVAEDRADAIVAHFPNLELLRAVAATNSRAIAILANSYNRKGIRSTLGRWKIVSLLNSPRFELVSNHCLPSTKQLAHIGVKREKLVAWDISHPFDPESRKPKELAPRQPFEAVYVGAIIEDKGVAELIRAIALLREQGIELHCSLAGLGDIDGMQALGNSLGVSHLLSFLRLIGNSEAFDLMRAADVVVVPSRTVYPEGFPLTMFEAIASRTPIVCSDHPMFREILIDGQNASVFRSGDSRALAAAIARTLTDSNLYATLSRSAPVTWAALKGPADWRTLIFKWVVEGRSSPWLKSRMLAGLNSAGLLG
jgi:glycosyltransferase involved in cell wall biosynthesis